MFKLLFALLLLHGILWSDELDNKIAKMIVIGFDGYEVTKNDRLFSYPLGGMILFDKNIKNPKQLEKLIFNLKRYSKSKLLICIDEEGGLVSRLGKVEGFIKTKSAQEIGSSSPSKAEEAYAKMAKMLSSVGINCNLAPSVDVAVNPENKVIVKNKRSFSKNPNTVAIYAEVFVKQMKKRGVISVLKHFPGHGSSDGDSHDGFVDVSQTWDKRELLPFKKLIDARLAKVVMTAHIFNKHLDSKYPATLSYRTNHQLLRTTLGFDGVLMSDDMQMGAISKNYSLKESLKLAINSGVDLLLFGNQLIHPIDVKEIVTVIKGLVKNGDINISLIDASNRRIEKLKKGIL